MHRRVLFIQTAFLGDVVLATSAWEAWHQSHPEDQIDVLVRAPMDELFLEHPWLNRVLKWDKRPRVKGRDWRRLLRDIRKTNYDVVINLHRHASSGILTALSMAPVRVGYEQPSGLAIHPSHGPSMGDGTHEVSRHLDLIAPFLNEGQQKQSPALYPGTRHEKEARSIDADGAVIVMPGCNGRQAWPEGQFSSLLDQTTERIVLLGSAERTSFVRKIG